MRGLLPGLAAATLLAACAGAPTPPAAPNIPAVADPPRAAREGPTPLGQRDLGTLASFLTGNWDSKPGDPPMRLRVAEVNKGTSARWFHLEWLKGGEAGPIARQLVFRVVEDGEGAMTATLHPSAVAAAIPGCRLKVQRTMIAHFTIVTEGNRCPGDLPGAPYMRFEFSIASSEMELLEQPRDAGGNVPPKSRTDPFGYRRTSTQAR